MSSISAKKSSFVIFGHGHNNSRNDSGDGMTSFKYKCDYCAFDVSGKYCWVVTKSGDPDDIKIRKLDTSTWHEVPHAFEDVDVGTEYRFGLLTYVENDNSNLGVLVDDTDTIIIFDLTTDEIVSTISGNLSTINMNYSPRATRVGDIIRVIGTTMNPSDYDCPWAVIDMVNHSKIANNQSGGYTISGFYNDTDITFVNRYYGNRQYIFGGRLNADGGYAQLWDKVHDFPNVKLDSFASNDNLFFPTRVGDVWQYGKYPIPPDLVTPSPIATFGMNANTIATPPVYTRGRTWASFRTTDNSLVVTDFVNSAILYTGDSPSLTPKAMGDPWILCDGSDGRTYLARYK